MNKMGVGLSYRGPFKNGLLNGSIPADHIELLLEHASYGGDISTSITTISRKYPCIIHSVSLSPCSVDFPLRQEAVEAARFLNEKLSVGWLGDHMSYSGIKNNNASQLIPPRRDENVAAIMQKNIMEISEATGLPMVIEYIAALDDPGGELSETEFLSRACDAGAGLLLDLHNVIANRNNFHIDPFKVLDELPLEHVVQVHLAGGRWINGRYVDSHDTAIDSEVWELYDELLNRVQPLSVIIERDGNYPSEDEIAADLRLARGMWERSTAPSATFPEIALKSHTLHELTDSPIHVERIESIVSARSDDDASKQFRGKTVRALSRIFPTSFQYAQEVFEDNWQLLSAFLQGNMTPYGQGLAASETLNTIMPESAQWAVDYDLTCLKLAYGPEGTRVSDPIQVRTPDGLTTVVLVRDEAGKVRIESAHL